MTEHARYETPPIDVLGRRLKALDRPGKHLWVVTSAWSCPDPERTFIESIHLDAESMVALSAIGCFKCEKEYSRKLAGMICRGSIDL